MTKKEEEKEERNLFTFDDLNTIYFSLSFKVMNQKLQVTYHANMLVDVENSLVSARLVQF